MSKVLAGRKASHCVLWAASQTHWEKRYPLRAFLICAAAASLRQSARHHARALRSFGCFCALVLQVHRTLINNAHPAFHYGLRPNLFYSVPLTLHHRIRLALCSRLTPPTGVAVGRRRPLLLPPLFSSQGVRASHCFRPSLEVVGPCQN